MIRIQLIAIPATLLLLSGCVTTKSSYNTKVAEADSLRSALAELNRENARLINEITEISKREAAYKENEATMSKQIMNMNSQLKRMEEAADSNGMDGKRWTIREHFIENLIESEKAAGRRIEELTGRLEACEANLPREKTESFDKPALKEDN